MESNTSTHNEASREASREEDEAGRETVVRRLRSLRVREEDDAGRETVVRRLQSLRVREEAGRETVVRRLRRPRVRVTALSAFVSHSSSTHDFTLPDEVDVGRVSVINVVVTIIRSRGLTDSLLPTDEEESLRSPPPPDLPIEGILKKVEVIDNGDVCAICMDELKVNDEARAIGHCSHTFHLDCVAEWVKRKPTCPLCRFEIPINGEGDDDKGVKRRRLV